MSAPSPNAAQIAYWNGPIGEVWAKAQEKRDRDHAGITAPLLALAAPAPGENILDIGCGSGTTTLMLVKLAGLSGRVTGIDLSRPMLTLARQRAVAAASKAEFFEGDASDYPFEKHDFDLAFSQLGVMFFADPVIAFRNFRRALKRQGRIVFACWRAQAEHQWAGIPESAAKPLLPSSAPSDPDAPGRFSLRHPDRIKQVLSGAGFCRIEISKQDARTFAGATADEAAASLIESGPLLRTLAGADDATRQRVRDALVQRLEREISPDGVWLNSAAWLVRAFA
jgi:SAM-dependent methyltransferase